MDGITVSMTHLHCEKPDIRHILPTSVNVYSLYLTYTTDMQRNDCYLYSSIRYNPVIS